MELLRSDEVRFLTTAFTTTLIVSVFLSLFARSFWLTDLFSHFVIQYIAGAIILAPLCILNKKYCHACGALIALVVSLLELGSVYKSNIPLAPYDQPASFTIIQFNKLVSNDQHSAIQQWLVDNHEIFDLVILQEADIKMSEVAEQVKTFYPNQITQPREHAFGTIILGKSGLLSVKPYATDASSYPSSAYELEMQPEGFKESIKIYTVHAQPPVSHARWRQRNAELADMGKRISGDKAKNIIAIGDWNITAYSPFFRDFVKASQLGYHFQPFYPEPTWPDKFRFSLFKIPIDHVLFSSTLRPIKKHIGNAMGSDHHPVAMTFTEHN